MANPFDCMKKCNVEDEKLKIGKIFASNCVFKSAAESFLKKASKEGTLKGYVKDLIINAERIINDHMAGVQLSGDRKKMKYSVAAGCYQACAHVYRMQFQFDEKSKMITFVRFMGHRNESGYGEA